MVRRFERLPGSIWALGFVSMFMDISSEMIHALLPVFLVTTLGASTVTVGLIEGIGEGTAAFSKLISGWLSDQIGKRKLLTAIGYGLGAFSKPLFAMAPNVSWVLCARFSDRVGKGIRGAPRDALLADLAPRTLIGAAYGLRQSLDTVGAFVGPLLAMALMVLFQNDFQQVFWVAVFPGLVAVLILVAGVKEPVTRERQVTGLLSLKWEALRHLGGQYWGVVAIATTLTLARFSEAFLVLRAEEAGLRLSLVPLVLVTMNVVYAASAYPLGALSDRVSRRALLAAGFLMLVIADILLAVAPGLWMIMAGVGIWGLHMGMTQGLLSALVAGSAPQSARGTAFGFFHLATGVAVLAASLVAGTLWETIGSSATFWAGGAFSCAGLAGLAILSVVERRSTTV